jgi:hypothetical protein
MRDELASMSPKRNESMIVNYDTSSNSGTHWVSLFTKKGESLYFDPFGLNPLPEVVEYCKEPRYFSSFEIQKPDEVICGHYCVYLIMKLSQGDSFESILDELVRSKKNVKVVRLSDTVTTIPILNESEWYEDYKNARKSDWASIAADRERFKRRIQEFELVFSKVMKHD